MTHGQLHKTFKVSNQDFIVRQGFRPLTEISRGSYGIVLSASYSHSSENIVIAIKKISNIFGSTQSSKRALRELKLLQAFNGHKNIISLYDMDIVFYPTGILNGIYIYEELMECDMEQIIKSRQPLTEYHYQFFIYQILCGLRYIHSADIIMRNVRPSNLLINSDCKLKICGFSLAQKASNGVANNNQFSPEYLTTRWYHAPELLLNHHIYTTSIDVWSTGCVLGELITKEPIFHENDFVNQLNKIFQILGTHSKEALDNIGSKTIKNHVSQLPYIPKPPMENIFPGATTECQDLLNKMLKFDSEQRITVDMALRHPYFSIWRDLDDERTYRRGIDFNFEGSNEMIVLKNEIIQEVTNFKDFIRESLLPTEVRHVDQPIILRSQEQTQNVPLSKQNEQHQTCFTDQFPPFDGVEYLNQDPDLTFGLSDNSFNYLKRSSSETEVPMKQHSSDKSSSPDKDTSSV
ncbi:hypothetical protein NCAS_0F02410 [Naumovozyma castellii]|uniref:Protein kinase domain-containing protein n=1 Tax=Naumovozyma castellii TaxID=27288 RepID=G0VGV4_NAUCA|nr:hypothetical protein NCAS_0F02410 [Naumovozyma castellii CBS 4309]CCC70725.1 hypothetical protein NCAS_0F02410 [Naumovozyma castellii CBS 4309]